MHLLGQTRVTSNGSKRLEMLALGAGALPARRKDLPELSAIPASCR